MNIIKLSVGYCGYYSNSEYNEEVYLLESDYNELLKSEEFKELLESEVYLGELDGKHSECSSEIDVYTISIDNQSNYNFNKKSSGECLYEHFAYGNEIADAFEDMVEKTNKYIKKIDSVVSVSYKIKKSQKELVDKYVEELKRANQLKTKLDTL